MAGEVVARSIGSEESDEEGEGGESCVRKGREGRWKKDFSRKREEDSLARVKPLPELAAVLAEVVLLVVLVAG